MLCFLKESRKSKMKMYLPYYSGILFFLMTKNTIETRFTERYSMRVVQGLPSLLMFFGHQCHTDHRKGASPK